jgi:hypothetical protein
MRAKWSASIPRYTRAERVIVPASPDWVASGALEERQNGVEDAFELEKQRRSRKLAESMHTKVVRMNSSFYKYNFESEKS